VEESFMRAKNDDLGFYFRDVRRFSPLGREEERALGRRLRRGDVEAAKALISANLRFVVKVAYGFRSSGLPIVDLVQEGNLGLMKAVSKFDPERGLRLISYAVWWIRAYIQAYVLRSWSMVRLGTTQAQRRLFRTLSREYQCLRQTNTDPEADDQEMARRLGVKPCEVIEMRTRMACRDLSLDSPVRADADVSLLDLLVDENASPEAQLGESEDARVRARKVQVALSRLGRRERFILERRMMSENPTSLEAIGDELQVSGERVRQLEIRARLKIRATLDSFDDIETRAA
jgi:RNA polymerase sigma-32 factor